MQLKTIQSIVKLYETGNISKASGQLYLTQQGLSRQVRALEEELGVTLFIRGKNGVTPTDICTQLYPVFQAMMVNYDEASKLVEAYRQDAHSLTIGFASGTHHGINNDFLWEYNKKHPEVVLKIQEWTKEICLEKLREDRLDLAILVNPFDDTDLCCQVLTYDDMYIAMHQSNPFAACNGPLDFKCLDGQRIITGGADNVLRQFFDHCCALTQISPQIVIASGLNLEVLNTMTNDAGLSTLTSSMALKVTNPEICIRKLILPTPGAVYCCRPARGKHQERARELMKFAAEYFRRQPIARYDAERQ